MGGILLSFCQGARGAVVLDLCPVLDCLSVFFYLNDVVSTCTVLGSDFVFTRFLKILLVYLWV